METTKEFMMRILKAAQTNQCIYAGTHDIEVLVNSNKWERDISIEVNLYPRTEEGDLIYEDEENEKLKKYTWYFREWYPEELHDTFKSMLHIFNNPKLI